MEVGDGVLVVVRMVVMVDWWWLQLPGQSCTGLASHLPLAPSTHHLTAADAKQKKTMSKNTRRVCSHPNLYVLRFVTTPCEFPCRVFRTVAPIDAPNCLSALVLSSPPLRFIFGTILSFFLFHLCPCSHCPYFF